MIKNLVLALLMCALSALGQTVGGGGVPGASTGSSLPPATGAGQVLTSTGAGTTYTAQLPAATTALSGSKTTSQRPLVALYPHTWGFFAGVNYVAPSGTTVWPNAQGQLNITGTAGSGAITLNSITVIGSGGINDYCTTANWAAVIQHDDGTYGNYTVTSCNASTVNITPTLAKNVTAGSLWNLYNAVLGQHLTGQGYIALANWLFGLKKYQGYISQAAGGRYFDSSCNAYGTAMTLAGGLTTGGVIPGTSIAKGMFENAVSTPSQLINNASGSSASTDANATPLMGLPCRITVGAGTAGQGVTQTVNLGGLSGNLHFLVAVGGQFSTTPASRLTVTTVVDGNTLQSTTSVAGMTEITVPYTNAWSGTVTITLTSSAPTVFAISDLVWYVWPPYLNAALQDPMISPAANTITNMDSWGTQSSNAFPVALQSLLATNPLGPSTGFTNTSLGSQTAIWAISNYATAVQPLRPDYAVYDYQINDTNTGAIVGYAISGGGSYGSAPTVAFTGTCSTQPAATAILTGTSVTALAFSQVGSCSGTPTVVFSPSGATATVTLAPNTGAQLLANINTLTNLTLANGTTPIYLRSLNTSSSSQIFRITLAEQQFNTLATTITPSNLAATSLSMASLLPNGTTAATQTTSDNSTDVATDAFVQANLATYAPLASPALIGSPTAPTQAPGDNTTKIATDAFVLANATGSATLNAANIFTQPQTAPAWNLQSKAAGPYSTYFDDFYTLVNANLVAIGSASGDACSLNNTFVDQNHPGNILVTSGTGGTGTGAACGPSANTFQQIITANSSLGWTWETVVYVPVLPGTTVGAYQAGMSHAVANPWTTGMGFYLSSANAVPNDWYCEYATTYTDSGVAASVSWNNRLTMVQDGTKLHWYIAGAEVCGTGVAIASLPSTSQFAGLWTATALSGTSVSIAADYIDFQRAVSR